MNKLGEIRFDRIIFARAELVPFVVAVKEEYLPGEGVSTEEIVIRHEGLELSIPDGVGPHLDEPYKSGGGETW